MFVLAQSEQVVSDDLITKIHLDIGLKRIPKLTMCLETNDVYHGGHAIDIG